MRQIVILLVAGLVSSSAFMSIGNSRNLLSTRLSVFHNGKLPLTASKLSRPKQNELITCNLNWISGIKNKFSRISDFLIGTASDPIIIRQASSKRMGIATWLAWWIQTILSVVSTITLVFANAVKTSSHANMFANGFFFAAFGLLFCYVNIFWTWSLSNLAGALPASLDKDFRNVRNSVKVAIMIAVMGMFITLIGAEQIVGTLVTKVVSVTVNGGSAVLAAPDMTLQALDIFVVQANTNTLLSHLAALINALYIVNLPWPRLPPPPSESPEPVLA